MTEQIAKTRKEERLEREAKTTQVLGQYFFPIHGKAAGKAMSDGKGVEEWKAKQDKKLRDAQIDQKKQARLRREAEQVRRYNDSKRPTWKSEKPKHWI